MPGTSTSGNRTRRRGKRTILRPVLDKQTGERVKALIQMRSQPYTTAAVEAEIANLVAAAWQALDASIEAAACAAATGGDDEAGEQCGA